MIDREGKKAAATEMRHRVEIQTVTRSTDNEGGYTQTWATASTVWAAVYPMRAQNRFDYKSVGVDATHIVKVRGDVSIAENQRLLFDNRVFEIITVEDIQERGVYKMVVCNERR